MTGWLGNPLCGVGRRRPLDEVGEERGHLPRFFVPFFPRAKIHFVIWGQSFGVRLSILDNLY